MLTSEVITEIIENPSKFLDAVNFFQFGID